MTDWAGAVRSALAAVPPRPDARQLARVRDALASVTSDVPPRRIVRPAERSLPARRSR